MSRVFFMMLLMVILITCVGCANSVLLEAEHVSHPLAGWPTEKQYLSEDDLTQASVLLHWNLNNRGYLDMGLGVNLQGNNGGGFYGPWLTGTVRVGYEIPLRP